jgi:hypothetical protein
MNPVLAFISSSGSFELGDLLFEFPNLSLQIFHIIVSPYTTKAASMTKNSRADEPPSTTLQTRHPFPIAAINRLAVRSEIPSSQSIKWTNGLPGVPSVFFAERLNSCT